MRTYVHELFRAARRVMLAVTVAVVPAVAPSLASAQDTPTGKITGRIVDAASGQPISAAQIQVVGTAFGTQSGVDGRYTILRVPAGTVTLQVRRIGYGPKSVTGLMLAANGSLEQDISLRSADVQLAAVSVTANKEKGSVNDALNAQKNATNVVNAITAEQIARSPDGDAAAAAQRVSGVTVQDGKYLQVRGLSERYTTASLNGARIPSPEPERKVVPLDLFPASLLQDVTTAKTFTPDMPGDFAGANVNIRTREFPARRQITYSTSMGFGDRVLGAALPFAPRAGGELFGMAAGNRQLPSAIANANFMGNVTQSQYNLMAREQRNVWTPSQRSGGMHGSFGLSTGGNTILGKRVGYVMSGNYGYTEEARLDERYAVGNQGPNNTVVPLTSVQGQTGRSSVQWGGIANFSTLVGKSSRLALNTTMTRSADNEARTDRGFDENLNDSIQRTTLRYVERGVATVTGTGEHQLAERHKTAWSLSYGHTGRKEPDRSDVVYARGQDGRYQMLASLDGARRLYFDLQEDNVTGQVDHTINLGSVASQNTLKVGGYLRTTDRMANAPIFAFISRANADVISQSPDVVFGADQTCETCAVVNVQPIGQAGSYDADDRTMAAYAMTDWGIGSRVRMVAGARLEQARITVNAATQGGFTTTAALNNTDVLPSLLLNARLTESQNLRFGITRTLARPEYRELAPVTFRDVLGGVSVTGNASLQRSLIDNLDLRWEAFPNPGEVVSVGLFAKRFDRPIERLEQATSGAYQARYANALSATNLGVELELRKQLGFLGGWGEGLTGFSNVTIMQSKVELDPAALTVTDQSRRLVGQAPYVVNTGLTWSNMSGSTNATVLYNVVGERISAAGVTPLPNIVEKPRHLFDVALRFPVWGNLSARLDARNLLDARVRFMQGNLEREGYNVGRNFSMGLSWRQ